MTPQQTTVSYHRSSGWIVLKSKLATVTLAFRQYGEKTHLKAWRGTKATKPAFYYTFRDFARAEKYATEYVQRVQCSENAAAKQRAEDKAARAILKASDFWTVGDVAYTSWGYDQTNVEFYEVVKIKPKSVVVREISRNCSDHGQPGGGKNQPRRREYVGPEIACPIDIHGNFSAGKCWDKEKPFYRHQVSKWNGRSIYTSSDH